MTLRGECFFPFLPLKKMAQYPQEFSSGGRTWVPPLSLSRDENGLPLSLLPTSGEGGRLHFLHWVRGVPFLPPFFDVYRKYFFLPFARTVLSFFFFCFVIRRIGPSCCFFLFFFPPCGEGSPFPLSSMERIARHDRSPPFFFF